jgi:eukaryotic-like serine/threonine-protein kinase
MAAAQKLAAALGNTFPLDTLVQRYWLPSMRAAIALERKDPSRAVELLKIANPTPKMKSFCGNLNPS